MSIIFVHWSSSGVALKRANTWATLGTSGHTYSCDSPSPYTNTQASTLHNIGSAQGRVALDSPAGRRAVRLQHAGPGGAGFRAGSPDPGPEDSDPAFLACRRPS
jgi:hypothetical protein